MWREYLNNLISCVTLAPVSLVQILQLPSPPRIKPPLSLSLCPPKAKAKRTLVTELERQRLFLSFFSSTARARRRTAQAHALVFRLSPRRSLFGFFPSERERERERGASPPVCPHWPKRTTPLCGILNSCLLPTSTLLSASSCHAPPPRDEGQCGLCLCGWFVVVVVVVAAA